MSFSSPKMEREGFFNFIALTYVPIAPFSPYRKMGICYGLCESFDQYVFRIATESRKGIINLNQNPFWTTDKTVKNLI